MDAATLALFAGAILSLAFSYIPGLNTKFAALSPALKRTIMAALLLLVSVYAYVEACTGIGLLGVVVTCDKTGIIELARVFVFALVANQSAYSAVQAPSEVRVITERAKAAHPPPA